MLLMLCCIYCDLQVMKYLFLLFSPDDVLPLDDFVMNTEAHPLPVKGKRGANQQAKATLPTSGGVAAGAWQKR